MKDIKFNISRKYITINRAYFNSYKKKEELIEDISKRHPFIEKKPLSEAITVVWNEMHPAKEIQEDKKK